MSKTAKIITFGTIAVILIIAAIKNPSTTESKQMIKEAAIEKINEKARAEMSDENTDGIEQFGNFLAMILAPSFYDKIVAVDVNDYIVCSSFKAKISFDGQEKNLVSGIILFGNIIPFSSDLKDNSKDKSEEKAKEPIAE